MGSAEELWRLTEHSRHIAGLWAVVRSNCKHTKSQGLLNKAAGTNPLFIGIAPASSYHTRQTSLCRPLRRTDFLMLPNIDYSSHGRKGDRRRRNNRNRNRIQTFRSRQLIATTHTSHRHPRHRHMHKQNKQTSNTYSYSSILSWPVSRFSKMYDGDEKVQKSNPYALLEKHTSGR